MQLAQHLLVGPAIEVGEERDLDRGERLQVDVGPELLEARAAARRSTQNGRFGMQPVDDVDFGERLIGARPQLVPSACSSDIV